MRFLPTERLTYRSPLDAETILSRLDDAIEPPKLVRLNSKADHKPYQGRLEGHRFQMSRIIYYRNSFLPRIRGEVRGEGFETTVEVRMNLHPLVWVFLAFWVGILGMMSLFLIPGALAGGGFDPFILMPPGMVLFAYAITLGGFKHESKKSRQFLAELLEAEAAEASR